LLRFTCVIVSVSPLNGVRQRLTPSHGAACESWPWPWPWLWAALLVPWLPLTAACDDVAVNVWALAAIAEPPELILSVRKPKTEFWRPAKLPPECDPDPLGWWLLGCGARKKLFVVSLVPKLYKKKKGNN